MGQVERSWEEVLAFSLRATTSEVVVAASEDAAAAGNRNGGFSTIIQGILFSRRFIISYQLVLAALLILFATRHWTKRLRSRKLKRTHRGSWAYGSLQGREDAAVRRDGTKLPSSGSILKGDNRSAGASSHDGDCEQTPLLVPKKPSSAVRQIIYRIRAFLAYQPRPIPFFNKILPSNGTTIAVLTFIGIQIFYLLYKTPLSIPMLFVFADRASLLFVANLPLLYLFAAKNQPIKLLTGYSYESLNIFHRRLGEVMCLLAFLHSIGMVGVWYTILRPTGFGLARFLLSKIILLGIGAFVAYELLYFTSLESFRRRCYELFLALHVSLQVIALVLLWFHHHNSRPYVGAALGIFLVDRLVYRLGLKVHSTRASLEVKKDGGTVVLRIPITLSQGNRYLVLLAGAGITKGWKATEHIFLTVPALSRKHIIQAHPFTIASKAPQRDDTTAELKLIIRAQDGFSRDLVRYAGDHGSVNVRIDGPYGSQNALHLLQQCDLSVIVAGGSGIAVALPLALALQTSLSSVNLEHRIGEKTPSTIILIWVIRHESHARWVDPAEFQILKENGVEVVVPPPTAETGQPDVPSMIDLWISTHDYTLSDAKLQIGVVCSGPDSMNRAVRNCCSSLLAQGRNVDVEVEKFGW